MYVHWPDKILTMVKAEPNTNMVQSAKKAKTNTIAGIRRYTKTHIDASLKKAIDNASGAGKVVCEELCSAQLPTLYEKYSATLIDSLRAFQRSVESSINPVYGPKYKPVQAILSQFPLLEKKILEKVSDAEKFGKSEARDTHLAIKPLIKTALLPFYERCLQDKGKCQVTGIQWDQNDQVSVANFEI